MQSCHSMSGRGHPFHQYHVLRGGAHHLQLCHGSEAIECSHTMGSGGNLVQLHVTNTKDATAMIGYLARKLHVFRAGLS